MKENQKIQSNRCRGITRYFHHSYALVLLLMIVWTGCKNDKTVTANPNMVGTYTLVSVNGNNVPCTIDHDGATPTVKSGSFIINSDGTCSSRVAFSLPQRGDSIKEVKATYKCQGTRLTMQWEGAGTTTGDVQGNTFTMNNEGMILVYRK